MGLFERIGEGRRNAIVRPGSEREDRALRRRINEANKNGDCIISGETGYYRPRPWVPAERVEANKYFAEELHRARDILWKRRNMMITFRKIREESEWELIAGQREQMESGSLPESLENMDLSASEDNNTAEPMEMLM